MCETGRAATETLEAPGIILAELDLQPKPA
jgi:hypothetical protein